ncbi:MAG: hypothetical protein QM784_00050 [Polyangiaceae bacterium]
MRLFRVPPGSPTVELSAARKRSLRFERKSVDSLEVQAIASDVHGERGQTDVLGDFSELRLGDFARHALVRPNDDHSVDFTRFVLVNRSPDGQDGFARESGADIPFAGNEDVLDLRSLWPVELTSADLVQNSRCHPLHQPGESGGHRIVQARCLSGHESTLTRQIRILEPLHEGCHVHK